MKREYKSLKDLLSDFRNHIKKADEEEIERLSKFFKTTPSKLKKVGIGLRVYTLRGLDFTKNIITCFDIEVSGSLERHINQVEGGTRLSIPEEIKSLGLPKNVKDLILQEWYVDEEAGFRMARECKTVEDIKEFRHKRYGRR